MDTFIALLAQVQAQNAAGAAPVTPPPTDNEIPRAFLGRVPIADIWQFITHVSWLQATVFIAFGMLYIIYGWRMYKTLVVINFAGLGLAMGMLLGGKLGSPLWGGLFGTVALGVVSYPFMKYSVAALGAVAGVIMGGALWRTVGLPEPLVWCGALAGLIAGGFLVFASFKVSIMLFSSLQGSMFMVIGILALLSNYPNLGNRLTEAVYQYVALLPSLVIIPTVGGIFFQQRLLKQNRDWAMPT